MKALQLIRVYHAVFEHDRDRVDRKDVQAIENWAADSDRYPIPHGIYIQECGEELRRSISRQDWGIAERCICNIALGYAFTLEEGL